MKIGKTPENVYERSVVKELDLNNGNLVCGADAFGEFCASFSLKENEELVVSKGCWASIKEKKGAAAVISAANAIAVDGAILKGVVLTVLMPLKYSEEKLKKILRAIKDTCDKLDTKIIRYTGEVTVAVNEPCIMATAIGVRSKESSVCAKASSGDDLVLAGYVGLLGSAIAADVKFEELNQRFSADYIEIAKEFDRYGSIKSEAALAVKSGAKVLKQVSKGGIYTALWELGRDSGVGLEVNLKDIPIKQETVEICNQLDLNPYELFSEGCLLIAVDNGHDLVNTFKANELNAAVIGKINDTNDRLIINDYERKFLTPPCPDELTKIL